MFNSNVQPKVIKKPAPKDWYCHKCDLDVPAYHKKCPQCRQPRND